MDEAFLREDIAPSLRKSRQYLKAETVAGMQVSQSSNRASEGQETLCEVENGDGPDGQRAAQVKMRASPKGARAKP